MTTVYMYTTTSEIYMSPKAGKRRNTNFDVV